MWQATADAKSAESWTAFSETKEQQPHRVKPSSKNGDRPPSLPPLPPSLLSKLQENSAPKTHIAISGIFHLAHFTNKTCVRSFISVKMVDRPVLKRKSERERETKSKTRKRSRNRPKQKETLCRKQSWKPSVFLQSETLGTKKAQRTKRNVHWYYDIKVVYSQETNLTRNVIQTGETHQVLPTSPE